MDWCGLLLELIETLLYSTLLRIAMDSIALDKCMDNSVTRPMQSIKSCFEVCQFANKFWEWVSSHRKGTTTLSFDNWLHLWRKPLDIQLKRCLPEPLQERAFPILNASNVAQRTHTWANERSQVVTTVPEFESCQCPTGFPMKILMTFLVCDTSTSRILVFYSHDTTLCLRLTLDLKNIFRLAAADQNSWMPSSICSNS